MKRGLAAILLASLTACTTSIPSTPAPTAAPTLSGELTASPDALRSDPDLTSPVERGKRELMDANITVGERFAVKPMSAVWTLMASGASAHRTTVGAVRNDGAIS